MTDQHPENNQVLHELFGKCWHEPHRPDLWEHYRCRHCKREYSDEEIAYAEYGNPDYAADPRLVLEGMRERGILGAFCDYLEMHGDFPYEEIIHESFSLVLDRTGVLGDLAIDFLKEQEGK